MKLQVGLSYLRSELHQHFGGNPRAGICPTRSGPVLVFSDPPSGTRFGYDANDEVVGDIYRYTGEGRSLDQQFVRGNKALLGAEVILLFSRIDSKSWIFVGEVSLADPAFEFAQAPDQLGNLRRVIVFRFLAKNAELSLIGRNLPGSE